MPDSDSPMNKRTNELQDVGINDAVDTFKAETQMSKRCMIARFYEFQPVKSSWS